MITPHHTFRRLATGVGTLGLFAATACSATESTATSETTTETKTVTTTATATASQQAPASAQATPGLGDQRLGTTVHLADIDLTVSEVKQPPSPGEHLPSDQRWWSAMAEACTTSDSEITLSWQPWSIQSDKGGTYPASNSVWEDFPKPVYPSGADRLLPNGKCTKGWIMFALSSSEKPSTVDYGNSVGENISWTVD